MAQSYFETFPLHPQLKRLESLTSYLIRLAEENGLQSLPLSHFLSQALRINQEIVSKDHLPISFGYLPSLAGCSEAILKQSTFFHMGQKFGYLATSNALSKSIAHYLRYCPMCLAQPENAFRSLTWRFFALQGCNQHGCELLNECTHCNQQIPVLTAPFHMNICPTCRGDLGKCRIKLLSKQEQDKVRTVSEDLEFLLSPQPWESTAIDITRHVGWQFTHLRLLKRLKVSEVCEQLGITWKSLEALESRLTSGHNVLIHVYFKYAEYLKVTLREVYDSVLKSLEEGIKPHLGNRRSWPSETEIVQQVHDAVLQLHALGRSASLSAISEIIYMNQSYRLRYKQVQKVLEQVSFGIRAEKRNKIERRHDELFKAVQQTVRQLEEYGESVTLKTVTERMEVTKGFLKEYKDIRAMLKQSNNYYCSYILIQKQQDEWIEKNIEPAISQLDINRKAITLTAIAKIIEVHPTTVKNRLKAKGLVAGSIIKDQRRKRREDGLVSQVGSAIEELRMLGKSITLNAIVKIVEVSAHTLRAYPRVEKLIENSIVPNKNFKRRTSQYDCDVLEKVEAAIQELINYDQKVTQAAISKITGISQYTLNRFPQINALRQKRIDEHTYNKRQEDQRREDELILKVKPKAQELEICGEPAIQIADTNLLGIAAGIPVRTFLKQDEPSEQFLSHREKSLMRDLEIAIQELEACRQPFSLKKLCKMAGHTRETFYSYPKIKALLLHHQQYKLDLQKVRKQQREEEILRSVQDAIKQLETLGLPIKAKEISKILNKNLASLYYYPKVAALIKDEIKDKGREEQLRQRQIREEGLVLKVLEAVEQLQVTNQPVTARAIARRLQLSTKILTYYPRVREVLEQIIQKSRQQ